MNLTTVHNDTFSAGRRSWGHFGIPCLALAGFFLAGAAVQAEEPKLSYVARAGLPLVNDPGGTPRAQLNAGVPVRQLEQRGEWVRVSVEGWVRATSLTDESPAKAGLRTGDAAGPLSVTRYEVKTVEEEDKRRKTALTLYLKNNSSRSISSWNAILVGIKGGQVVVREPLSQRKAAIAPGADGDATFYWKEHEAVAQTLQAHAAGLDFRFVQLTTR